MKVDWPAALAQHDAWLRMVVLARVGQVSAIDEVMQEVALAVMRQQTALASSDKVAAYLYGVAVRQSLLHRRRQGRYRKLTAHYAEQQQSLAEFDHESEPLRWLLRLEQRDMVRRALAELRPRDAEILMLKYTQNWTYAELGHHLNISASAVEARLHRARQRLRQQLSSAELARNGEKPR